MLIDTHCHINIMTKSSFDSLLKGKDLVEAKNIIKDAQKNQVNTILNVGTSLIESINCITLAKKFDPIYAAIGIHPNDLSDTYKQDIDELKKMLLNPADNKKIKAIGECGLDYHYPGYNKQRQYDGFKRQIELALEFDLPLCIHTRDAQDESLRCLEEFKDEKLRGVIHCFSENLSFAKDALKLNFVLGIGGTLTYPKNTHLRETVQAIGLDHITLETDAPYLPPQIIRGKKNSPAHIKTIADYIANLLNTDLSIVASKTTYNAQKLFNI